MGLQALLAGIHELAEQRVKEIREEAEAKRDRILASAQEDAEGIRAAARETGRRSAQKEKAKLQYEAALRERDLLHSAADALIQRAIEQARRRIKSFREDPQYERLLLSLVEESSGILEPSLLQDEPAILVLHPDDKPLLQGSPDSLPQGFEIQTKNEVANGVIARSGDGRVQVDNRLESRLDRALIKISQTLTADILGEVEGH